MNVIRQVPLIGCIALAYAFLAVFGSGAPASAMASFTLPSGASWTFAIGDFLLLLSVIALYFEILKATRTSQASVLDHILSLFSFVACQIGRAHV